MSLRIGALGFLKVASLAILRGSNYVIGVLLNVDGGSGPFLAQIRVESINDSGVIQTATLFKPGAYTAVPASPVSTTSTGAGTGATFSYATTETLTVVRLVSFEFDIDENYLIVFTAPTVFIFRKEDTGSGPNQLVDQQRHPFTNQKCFQPLIPTKY